MGTRLTVPSNACPVPNSYCPLGSLGYCGKSKNDLVHSRNCCGLADSCALHAIYKRLQEFEDVMDRFHFTNFPETLRSILSNYCNMIEDAANKLPLLSESSQPAENSEFCAKNFVSKYEKLTKDLEKLVEKLVVQNEQSKHISELLEAENEDRLIVLPCELNTRVFKIVPNKGDCKSTCLLYCDGRDNFCEDWDGSFDIQPSYFKLSDISEFDKTIFLTREAAEKRIEKRCCT